MNANKDTATDTGILTQQTPMNKMRRTSLLAGVSHSQRLQTFNHYYR